MTDRTTETTTSTDMHLITLSLKTVTMLSLLAAAGLSQPRTVGTLLNEPEAFPGYTLFSPMQSNVTYLIDNDGRMVRSWTSSMYPGASVYLLPDGKLLRTGTLTGNQFPQAGVGGAVEMYDWDGALVWQYIYSNLEACTHHDAIGLPNGNVLMIAWERVSRDSAVQAGRDPSSWVRPYLWPDRIVEVEPTDANGGNVVWQWRAWDHVIQDFDSTKDNFGNPAEHPDRIDVNFRSDNSQDWMHSNGLGYNEQLDQIVLTVHNFHEIWVIDHSTTTEQAAGSSGGTYGKGGRLLYRWGHPRAYRHGTAEDQKLFGPHDAHWIEPGLNGEGNILIFNNGLNRTGNFSTVEEIRPPVNPDGSYSRDSGKPFGPAAPAWMFMANPPESMFSRNISGAHRLPNGNTLICAGASGRFLETTSDGRIVWEYVSPVIQGGILKQGDVPPGGPFASANSVFKIRRYPASYPGLAGKDLTPGDFIEIYDPSSSSSPIAAGSGVNIESVYPQPAMTSLQIRVNINRPGALMIKLHDVLGREVLHGQHVAFDAGTVAFPLDPGRLPSGLYMLSCSAGNGQSTRMIRLGK